MQLKIDHFLRGFESEDMNSSEDEESSDSAEEQAKESNID